MKRSFDVVCSLAGLLMLSPILLAFMFLVYLQDKGNPLYLAPRVGLNGSDFRMAKIRSMVLNADKTGVDSTSSSDDRITPVGHLIRKYKLDEFMQLWNVLVGDMSLVGPRPNVKRDTDLYTDIEKKLLSVRPGITDFSSIVFSDEGEILKDKKTPDIAYNQLIRPWKSRLGLLYIENQSLILDIKLILITIMTIFSRGYALRYVQSLLKAIGTSDELICIAEREIDLEPTPPPGSDRIVTSR